MANYNSIYTGEQIDEAVGKSLSIEANPNETSEDLASLKIGETSYKVKSTDIIVNEDEVGDRLNSIKVNGVIYYNKPTHIQTVEISDAGSKYDVYSLTDGDYLMFVFSFDSSNRAIAFGIWNTAASHSNYSSKVHLVQDGYDYNIELEMLESQIGIPSLDDPLYTPLQVHIYKLF